MPKVEQNIRGVIFDLDGTLGDTVQISLEGFRRAIFKFSGLTYSDEEILATWGPTEEGVFMQLFPSAWEDAVEEYLKVYDQLHIDFNINAFKDIPELLTYLGAVGVRLAVVTAKGPHSAEISLKHFGMLDTFEFVEVGLPERANKPDRIRHVLAQWGLPPTQVLYVGDFPSDIKASKQAGTISIGAAWAPTADSLELARHNPDYLFDSIQDFRDWLKVSLDGDSSLWRLEK